MSQSINKSPVISKHEDERLSLKPYVYGYIISLVLTATAYLSVRHHAASTTVLVGLVVILALTQFIVQVFYFLHLGKETKPRWKLYIFFLMVSIVLIIVFGSIWIINNLNSRMTIPQQIQYLNSQDGL
ncbi:MAG TPA: cytochrome C oxidase subunit IV family protein [Candidatus Saccharimonadales bacterium]